MTERATCGSLNGMFLCGYQTGVFHDQSRPNWDGDGPRPIRWSAWYPTLTHTSPPPGRAFFELGTLEYGAPPEGPLPTVVLSHGTGGTAESLGWLARHLALQGRLVLGANHHGNTGLETYRAEGFLCWWERSRDLSVLLTWAATASPFAAHVQETKTTAIGFSLGGPTVLALLGARYDMALLEASLDGRAMPSPPEFPELGGQVERLHQDSAVFRDSWARHGADLADPRIARAIALAPAPPVRALTPRSLAGITRPVTLLTGGADREAPTDVGARWLVDQNPSFAHHELGAMVGHYSFLGLPAAGAARIAPRIFTDAPGLDRGALHLAALHRVDAALAS